MKKTNILMAIRSVVVRSNQRTEKPVPTSFVNQTLYQKSFEEADRAKDEKLKTLVAIGKRKI